jgi:gliding motility-associated-like protein
VPGITDDVVFDAKSSDSPSIIKLLGEIKIHDFNADAVTKKILFEGSSFSRLTIKGSLNLRGNIDWQYEGRTTFATDGFSGIDYGFASLKGDVIFDGSGDWELKSNIIGGNAVSVVLENGKISIGSFAISSGILIQQNGPFEITSDQGFINATNFAIIRDNLNVSGSGLDIAVNRNNPNTVIGQSLQTSANLRLIDNSGNSVQAVGASNIDDVTCNGSEDGSVLINWAGGAPCASFQIQFNPTFPAAPYNAPASPFLCTNIPANTYLVRVICLTSGIFVPGITTVEISQPAVIQAVYDNSVIPLCNGGCNGEISYSIAGGNLVYNVDWAPTGGTGITLNASEQDTIKNLCAGTYTINIVDTSGCTGVDSIMVVQPAVISPNSGVGNQLCFGACDGYVYVAPSGGTPFAMAQASGLFYQVQWDGNVMLTNDTLYNLCPGTHSFVITDGNNCSVSGSVTITAKTPLVFTKSIPGPITCADICNGNANVTAVSGGTPPYSFSWTGPSVPTVVSTATTSTATAMCAGTYSCTITDGNGCDTTTTFIITAPPLLVGGISTTNVSCFNGNNGTATGSHTGGTGPTFIFNWFSSTNPTGGPPFSTASPMVSGLIAGTYTLVVIDNNGCNDTVTFTITQPTQLQVTLTPTNPNCFAATNGQVCANPTGGTGGIALSWLPVGGTVAGNCYTNLGAGTYTVTATDANTCTATATTTLTVPPQIFPNLTHTDPTCNMACNGTATSAPVGGSNSGFTFVWSCSASTSASITGECAGTCTVTVTDDSGCSQTASTTFVDPNPLTVSVNATTLNCAGASTAQIASTVNGGTAPYTYSWNTGPTTPGLSNVPAGSYTLTVTDDQNCVRTASVTIASPTPIVIMATPTNPTCSGGCNGSISTTLSGGTAPYTVLWNPTNSTNLNQVNLCAFTYTINVRDANNCLQSQTVVVANPTPVTVTTDSTLTSCIGVCDGTATATATGGNMGGYTYLWNLGGQTTQTAVGLCDGTYTVTVTDPLGCVGSSTATVTEPTAVTVSISAITPSCSNICTGTATINAGGGTPGYTYTLDMVSIGATTALSGLCSGTHTLVATDLNGCTATTTFVVPTQVSIFVTSSSTTLTCNGDCDAIATANVSGANGTVSYSWMPTGQSTQTATGLCAGIHTVTITDGVGCTVSTTATFIDPPALTATMATTPVDCHGNCTGTAKVTPGGGTPPYTVTWSNGATTDLITGLCVGTYTATIVDANGCTIQSIATITQPTAFTVSSAPTPPTTCGGTDGSITVTPSGGSGTYTFNWSAPGGNTATLSNLVAGVYTLTLTDAITGCDTVIPFALSDPSGPLTTQSSTNVSCPGACIGSATVNATTGVSPMVTWPGGTPPPGPPPVTATNLCAGVYNVLVTDATTCISFETVIITQPFNFVDNEVLTNITCNGTATGSIVLNPSGGTRPFTYTINGIADDSSMTNLLAGTHTVVVTDVNGCSYTFNYTLTQPTLLTATETHANINCTTGFGSATAIGSGGVMPYTFLWSNGATTATAANLITGTYTCTITDANGCTAQVTATVSTNPPIVSGFTSTDNLCNTGCSGTATFAASGGSGVYTYAWSSTGLTTPNISGICPGSYTATVSDNNGCSVTESYTITAPPSVALSLSSTNPSCNGSGNGTVSSTPSGGTPGYTYSWSPNVSVSQNAINLTDGSYTLTVSDINGCTATQIATLTEPAVLLSNVIPTQPTCFGDCNGILVSAPAGGTAPYSYAWGPSPTGSNDSLTGLCTGSYSVVITDANSCRDSTSITLAQPPQVGLTASSSAANCGTVPCNGSITINSIVGDSVNWLNSIPPGFTGLSQTNLCAGIYNIEVINANGCKDTVAVGVSNANGPLVTLDTDSVSCLGNCNGSATIVAVSSGNPPYSYSWAAPITDTDSIATNLCTGTYLSQVTDANGCTTITAADIDEPLPLDDHEVITSAACTGVNSGSIVLAPTGGTAPFSYAWSNMATNSPSNPNLAPGTYSVTITDANLCTYQFVYNVGFNSQILYQMAVTNPTCFGQCNGTVVMNNVNGGTAPYTFVWNDGQSGTTANMLCAGSYTVTITDNVGCSRIVDTLISQPSQLAPNPTVTNTACGVCAGTIALAPTGGTSSYNYVWSNGQSTSTATGLCSGIYMVDVTDALGCASQFSIAVNNTNGPTVNTAITNVACGGQCTGAATVTPTGGTAPYQYNWISGGQTSATVSSMCAGTYFVQVKDGGNCVINDTVVITETAILVATNTTTPTTCNACNGAVTMSPSGGTGSYTYVWSGGLPATSTQSGLCAGNYSVVVADGAGCAITEFITINSNNAPVVSVATDSVLCNGNSDGQATVGIIGGTAPYTVSWSTGSPANPTLTGIMAGTYAVSVTDAIGCSTSKTFTIEEPNPLALSLNNTLLPGCAVACNGAVTAIPSGGSLGYSYAWVPGGATTGTISNLCAGTYSVAVTDSKGCLINQVTQLDNNPMPFAVVPTNVNASCGQCDGSSSLLVTGGVPTYTYNWSNGSTSSSTTNLCAGVYMVDITDNIGCSQQYSVAISNTNGPVLDVDTTDVTCAGQCTGTATVTVSGGTAPYQYNWLSGGQTTASVTGLCAGTYFVQVRDANNCTTTESAIINEQTAITANTFTTAATACGACDGTATLNPSGGSGSYTFVWSGGLPATAIQTGLCAGIYSVEITDAMNGCKDTTLLTIISSVNAPLVTVSVDSVQCNGSNNGQATVSVSGGVSPYVVIWSTGSVVNPTLSGLGAGTYAVTVEDALGCISGQVFTVEEPNPLTLSLNNTQLPSCSAACNGALVAIPSGGTLSYTYLWSPGNTTADTLVGLCAGTYSVQVTDSKGCSTGQVTQLNNNPVSFTVTPTTTSPACGACDGSSSLAVVGGLAPYTFSWGNGDNTSTGDSLCAGVYPVNITDALGCAQQYSVAVSNPNGPSLNVTITDIACAGQCTGAASVVPSGGSTPYQYNWLSGGQTTAAVSGLCVGTYFVQVRDADNCISTQPVDINEQTLLVANAFSTNTTCGVCNGTATLNPTGGSGTYTYVWSTGATTQTLTGLCAGTYSAEITDAGNGCKDTVFIAISSSNTPLVLLDVDSVICNGNADGQAILTISGGSTPYTVAWSTGSAANPALTGLAAGNYAVSVTDNAGCVSAQVFTIDEPDQLGLSLNNTQLPNCAAVCNGALTAIPSGGALPYSYAWSPGGATTDTLGSLCAGTYSVTVTDQRGCSVTQTTILNNNPTPFSVTNVVTSPACNMCDGVIDITLTGGMAPFTYAWNNGSITEDIDSVCAGLYQVNITDSVGCAQTVSLPVSNSAGITGETIVSTNESCFGSCDGTATVTPIGGTPGYSYQWLFNGDTTNNQTNLCAGTYYLQISDTVGCIRTSEIEILSPSQMIVVPSIVSPSCGNSDGSITLNVSGGTGTLSYAWTPAFPGNTNAATNLPAGIYVIDITDSSPTPCTQSFTVNLSNISGPAVVVLDTNVSCKGLCDGSITLNITNTNPTTVFWNTGSGANPLVNLCPGNYTATITDNVLGCLTAIAVTITEPDTLNFSLVNSVDPLCNGICTGAITSIPSGGTLPYTFNWSPVTGSTGSLINLCANSYTVTVTDANGCMSTQNTTLVEPTDIVTTGITTNASCSSVATGSIDITATGGTPNSAAPAYTYQWSGGSTSTTEDLTSILFGSYTVVVTDANSCTDTTTYNVSALDTVISNAGPDLTFCVIGDVILDGSASFINNGTITYQWLNVPASGTVGTDDSLLVSPVAGTFSYQLIVSNSLGCSDTDTVMMIGNPLPLASAGPDVEIVYGQSASIGGSPTNPIGTTLSWLPAAGLSGSTIPNPVSSNTVTTTYTVTVIDTATGCVSRDSVLFTVLPQVIIPNGISPNGDLKNDTWIIDAIYKFPNNEVEIYNRWGELLYSKKAYDNSWGGTYNGKPLPIGTYYYVVKLNDDAYPEPYTGPITIFK